MRTGHAPCMPLPPKYSFPFLFFASHSLSTQPHHSPATCSLADFPFPTIFYAFLLTKKKKKSSLAIAINLTCKHLSSFLFFIFLHFCFFFFFFFSRFSSDNTNQEALIVFKAVLIKVLHHSLFIRIDPTCYI